jgi:tetratricopeptide (TPR) repeat protein
MEVFCADKIANYDPEILDNNIVGKIQATQNQTSFNAANLVIAVKPVQEKGKEVVQFKLIRSYSKNSLTEWYLDPNSAPKLFDVSYYEAKFYQFKQFIRDSEVYNIPTKTVNPNDYTGHYSWGVIKYQAGDYEGAISDFNNAIDTESDTTFSMIYSYRGIAKTKLGEFNGAIEDFDKAIDLQPSNVMHYSNWVKNYYNRGVARFYVNDLNGACADWEKSFDLGFGAALENLGKYCK